MADDDAPRVDPQTALSNERTFLSWIRTSLALVATGAALVAFNLPIAIEWRVASGAVFAALGIVAAVQGWLGWRHTDRELARGGGVPTLRMGAYITAGVVLAVVILGAGAVLA
jgi:putative membrane protein